MTDEVEVKAVEPAPEQAATVAPEPEVQAPDKADEKPIEKTFTQKELDEIVSKRLAKEQRKLEREFAKRQAEAQQPRPEALKPDQFESPEAYAEALAERKAEEKIRQREQQRYQEEVVTQYHEREEEARGKYEDFEQVAYNPRLPITDVMAQTIQASEVGPDLAYYLGQNPKEAERISRLPPFLQAKEIGRIEAKVSAEPPVTKKTTSAPAPIEPVTPRSTGTPAYDTTDPRSTKTMSTSEWIAAERLRQIKKAEAQRHR